MITKNNREAAQSIDDTHLMDWDKLPFEAKQQIINNYPNLRDVIHPPGLVNRKQRRKDKKDWQRARGAYNVKQDML